MADGLEKRDDRQETYVVRAGEIAAMGGTSKTHFLNGNARRVNKSLGDLTGLTGFGFHLIEVEPGCQTSEYHLHHHEDECVYVLDGEVTAISGGEEYQVGPRDFVGYRNGGRAHTIRNTGKRPLRCIVVGERLPHDVGDYPNQRKRIYRNVGLPWAVVDYDAITEPRNVGKK